MAIQRADPADKYVPVPDDYADLGPAMKALAPQQRRFVVAFLETGGRNATRAYAMAGYTSHIDHAKSNAWHLLHLEKVQAALREEAKKRFNAHAPLAVTVVAELLEKETLAPKDRLRAAEMILNRTGLHAKIEHETRVTHQVDEASLITKIEGLAKELGLDASKLLGGASKALTVIEAETYAVPEPTGAEGLEDIL